MAFRFSPDRLDLSIEFGFPVSVQKRYLKKILNNEVLLVTFILLQKPFIY